MKTTFEGLSFVMPENWMKYHLVDSEEGLRNLQSRYWSTRNNLYDPMGEMTKQKKKEMKEMKEIRYEIDVEEFNTDCCNTARWTEEYSINKLRERILGFAILVKEQTTKTPNRIDVQTGIGEVKGFDVLLYRDWNLADVPIYFNRSWNAPMDKITVTFIFE